MKSELEIANDILSFLRNIDDQQDAEDFLRIYVEALIKSTEETGYYPPCNALIRRLVSEVDLRIAATNAVVWSRL